MIIGGYIIIIITITFIIMSSLYLSNVKKEKNTYFVNFALVYQLFRHKYSQFNHSNINIICSPHETKVQLLKGAC